MKTVAINVMNLCVPCENRCRYCLLSYDGRTTGIDFHRSTAYAKRFHDWLAVNRPELSFSFGFGYSMEHPELISAIRFCQSIGSVTGEFLQFDGMAFRSDEELEELLATLKENGIKLIDLTFYGTEDYHDRFAARSGDFRLMVKTLRIANQVGLDVSVSIPLTHENHQQIESLLEQLSPYQIYRTACFIPHCEGRGKTLDKVRFTAEDYERLHPNIRSLLNTERFKAEKEWVQMDDFPKTTCRVLTVTLTPENIESFEHMDFSQTIAYLEKLDDTYHSVVPGFEELRKLYGDPTGTKMYSARDLFLSYQKRFIAEQNIETYDINDERQCFIRRV